MPSFEIADAEVAEVRLEFFSFWDGYMEAAEWWGLNPEHFGAGASSVVQYHSGVKAAPPSPVSELQ